ncbi:asparagine synthase-related protein [Natronosalvus rutilus]|uniref:Asparagine synthase-related protein n=1 Tax=Natronosalvus rutilus TaxID=2953753 RepID=A0A9E7N8Q3_9EURY|nr:asparagine synthase-related protein [Natronosalvus rutilus]UTF52564.1 asparagine synthase-related protein [Natronosalvus rutilus]
MVGLTGRIGRSDEEPFAASLESLRHTDRLKATVTYDEGVVQLGHTAYPEYPIDSFERGRYRIRFEGKLYNVPNEKRREELERVAPLLFEDESADADTDDGFKSLLDWLLSVDGAFVLTVLDTATGELALCNDVLGRLPTYFYADEESMVFSRELRYVLESVDVEFDRLGAAQCLLFGYSLGDRTLVENVRRLRPGSLVRVRTDTVETSTQSVYTFSFDDPTHAHRSREQNATQLATRFVRACERRAGHFDTDLISLSGGLDSRSVLAGYHAAGCPVEAATMESPEYVPVSDVDIAQELAADFEVDWRTYDVGQPRGADLDTLVKTKNGHIGLMTSFVLTFLRHLEADYGASMAYITGDGGDKVLPDLTPTGSVRRGALVDYIVEENSILDIDQVSRITRVSEDAIRQSIREHVRTYPETTVDGLYTHFLLYERAANFLFEGEDRNRLFFWSDTPFYSLPFFRYAMNCPPEQKRRYNLYRSFLEALSPKAASRTHAVYGAPVSSRRHAAAALLDDVLSRHPAVLEVLKPIIKAVNDLETESNIDADTIDCIRQQVDRIKGVDVGLDTNELHRFLDTADDREKYAVYRIFAITSIVDDLSSSNRKSVLESREDAVFA